MHTHTHAGDKLCEFICSVNLYPDFELSGGSFLMMFFSFGSLHHGDLGSITNIVKIHATSIFRAEVRRVCGCSYFCGMSIIILGGRYLFILGGCTDKQESRACDSQ
jgi:hypothetical protein